MTDNKYSTDELDPSERRRVRWTLDIVCDGDAGLVAQTARNTQMTRRLEGAVWAVIALLALSIVLQQFNGVTAAPADRTPNQIANPPAKGP